MISRKKRAMKELESLINYTSDLKGQNGSDSDYTRWKNNCINFYSHYLTQQDKISLESSFYIPGGVYNARLVLSQQNQVNSSVNDYYISHINSIKAILQSQYDNIRDHGLPIIKAKTYKELEWHHLIIILGVFIFVFLVIHNPMHISFINKGECFQNLFWSIVISVTASIITFGLCLREWKSIIIGIGLFLAQIVFIYFAHIQL